MRFDCVLEPQLAGMSGGSAGTQRGNGGTGKNRVIRKGKTFYHKGHEGTQRKKNFCRGSTRMCADQETHRSMSLCWQHGRRIRQTVAAIAGTPVRHEQNAEGTTKRAVPILR